MTDQDKLWKSLAAYLSGNANDEDRVFISKWLEESPANRVVLEELKAIWQGTGVKLQYPDVESSELLQDLRDRISKRNTGVRRLIRPALYFTAAATVCLLVVFYFTIDRTPPADKTILQSGKEVIAIYLPDSTKVWLNTNSRIEFPKAFTSREIELRGEAFFAVRKDSSDFIIRTRSTETRVLGTSFNLREDGDSLVTITVAKGKVRFNAKDAPEEKSIEVALSYKGTYGSTGELKTEKNDDPDYAAWREQNNPVFTNEKNNPGAFLLNEYSWRKNTINQTVVEGTITNQATLAAYSDIVLELTYNKTNGDLAVIEVPLEHTVGPGHTITYRKRLLDILTSRQKVTLKVKSANASGKNVY